ncbi:MAG: hypothetical protein ACLPX9_05910 [Rhodomicrobium sp.]
MDRDAKLELANAILDTHKAREKTYSSARQCYSIDYFQAARQAVPDPDLRPIVAGMLVAGYVEFHDWARETVKGQRSNRAKSR